MLCRHFASATLALALSLLATADSVAAAQRTFVASNGNDAHPCSLTLPCRAFAAAISQTAPGGEVIVLDSAGYGPVTIAQSISIVAPSGVYAGISVPALNDGVTVAAGVNDIVTLRGLTINGQGGNRGVVVTSGGDVNIEHCIVAGLAQSGIEIDGGTRTHIRSCVARNNGGGGLYITIGAGAPTVSAVDSYFFNNQNGVIVNSGTFNGQRIIADGNSNVGVLVFSFPGPVTVTLTDSIFSTNGGSGVDASGIGVSSIAVTRSTSARNFGDGFTASPSIGGSIFLTVSDSAALENSGNGVRIEGDNTTGVVTSSTLARNIGADIYVLPVAVLRSSGNNTLTGRGAADIIGVIVLNPLK